MILILIILIAVLILSAIVYLVSILFIKLVFMLLKRGNEFKANKKYKVATAAFSVCITFIFCCYYLFSNPVHNYKTAYIQKATDKYIVTIFSEKKLMSHDPISFLRREIYLDSAKFELLKNEGVIDGTEISYKDTYFKFLKGSNIIIKGESMTVGLEYIDSYYQKRSELYLNGKYNLKWLK